MLALPIFPGSHPPSIVGVHELNFCVRDGNRWTLMTINTNFCGWLLTISMSNDFRHLTLLILAHSLVPVKLFFKNLGDPYRIRTDVKGVRGLCLNRLTNGPDLLCRFFSRPVYYTASFFICQQKNANFLSEIPECSAGRV